MWRVEFDSMGQVKIPAERLWGAQTQGSLINFSIGNEATAVTPMGVGYPNTPGIWTDEQMEGWRLVTDAVHKGGGRMCLQLWHVGRISDPIYLRGKLPVAPSALAPEGQVNLLRPKKNYVVPRALELEAEQIYREDLTQFPENGWSLYGLAHSLTLQHKEDEGAEVEPRFDKIWANADLRITSSCLCQPGK